MLLGDRADLALATVRAGARPRVGGKFLWAGAEKLYVQGVTYGTFTPDGEGNAFHDRDRVDRDFAQIASNGINAVRVYTVPPRWLLDTAHRYGLRVMIGLPWEQHITFLDDRARIRDIEARFRAGVRSCAGHPAVLCFAIGNEIPAPIVRWHGARRVEDLLERLYRAAKDEDPDSLVTYVNYPSTEYLELPFVDFLCFNVYLETQERLEPYLARLQNIAGDRPLVMAEIGLDSRRNGLDQQAATLDWQVRLTFGAGAAGVFVFSWTDEWYRGGQDIEDWDFGLTDRERRPKPALETVREAFREVPFPDSIQWPRISVVVCSCNGAKTIGDCCEGLSKLEYPNVEVIVIDDGSTDDTAVIAGQCGFRVITTENQGLSSARNTGYLAASGEIVAYIDDDARPDPHWLLYLAASFLRSRHVGIGGPNIAPPGGGRIADCVANAPGGPVHVLLSDQEAEHIPGCNMAFRKSALEAVGGFDPRYRAAGDDVDICWRLQERGWTLGFSPAAMVWHRRRNSVRAYWRQQKGYGKAEALLEQKWPERYNGAGHVAWSGRLYGKGLTLALPFGKGRVYQGSCGSAPFQSVYESTPGTLRSLPLMPEWYLFVGLLAALATLAPLWQPLIFALPLLALAVLAPVVQAVVSASHARFAITSGSRFSRLRLFALTTSLHMLQPLARLWGRQRHGLRLLRQRGGARTTLPWFRRRAVWSEQWLSAETWMERVEAGVRSCGAVVLRGGPFDRWDLEVRRGMLGTARVLMAIEEHGAGKQLARFAIRPRSSLTARVLVLLVSALGAAAAFQGAWAASLILSGTALILAIRILLDAGDAIAFALSGIAASRSDVP
jgi:O-antigen biosynthesis protein